MLLVFGTVNECYYAVLRMSSKLLNCYKIIIEFLEISVAELCPFQGVMVKPFPKYSARGDLLEPKIDTGRFFGHASWPESIHKNPKSIVRFGSFICPFQFDDHGFLFSNRNQQVEFFFDHSVFQADLLTVVGSFLCSVPLTLGVDEDSEAKAESSVEGVA